MKLEQFFQDEKGFLSMSRLLLFLSFIIASFIMLKIQMTEGYFIAYLGTFAGTYVAGKGIDKIKKNDP